MDMSKVNKGGRPKDEPTSLRSLRLPVRLWNMVYKASKDFRSVNEYFLSLVENDLTNRKMLKESDHRKNKSKHKKG